MSKRIWPSVRSLHERSVRLLAQAVLIDEKGPFKLSVRVPPAAFALLVDSKRFVPEGHAATSASDDSVPDNVLRRSFRP